MVREIHTQTHSRIFSELYLIDYNRKQYKMSKKQKPEPSLMQCSKRSHDFSNFTDIQNMQNDQLYFTKLIIITLTRDILRIGKQFDRIPDLGLSPIKRFNRELVITAYVKREGQLFKDTDSKAEGIQYDLCQEPFGLGRERIIRLMSIALGLQGYSL